MNRIEAVRERIKSSTDPRPADIQRYPGKPLYETQYYRFLYELVRDTKPAIVVEIGTRRGESAIQMATAHPGSQILTIDIDPNSAEFIRKMKLKNLRAITSDSAKAVHEVKIWAPFDMLFIDSDHCYERATAEFKAYSPFVKKGGIMIFDDIHINDGMTKFWNEITYPKIELNELHIKGFGAAIKT